jgi:two-component system, NarL family, invasion response regulator UvrY
MSHLIQIMLADDHALVRQGCRQVLEDAGFEIVCEAINGEDAYIKFCQHRPRVVIMDLSMNNGSGLDAINRIYTRFHDARILVLTMHDDPHIVARALKAGAIGYLSKTADADTLVAAVKHVGMGKSFLSNEIALPLALTGINEADNPLGILSPREFEIFRLLADGTSNTEIAQTLSMSKKTVTNYYMRIKQKLGQRSLADLVKLAIRYGVNKQNILP